MLTRTSFVSKLEKRQCYQFQKPRPREGVLAAQNVFELIRGCKMVTRQGARCLGVSHSNIQGLLGRFIGTRGAEDPFQDVHIV